MNKFIRETSGAAALEFAIWLGVLVLPVLNLMDIGLYLFQRIQVENAAQMAVQAAWATWPSCTEAVPNPPADTTCTDMTDAATLGAHKTTLGDEVTASTPVVGKYCVEGGVLKSNDTCTVPGTGVYVQVSVSRPYTPMFGNITVASLFADPMTLTSWARVK